jgi:hypothetical protein
MQRNQPQQKIGEGKVEPAKRHEEEKRDIAETSRVCDKFPQVVCFRCGEPGHFSSACNKPKVCFICYQKEHTVDDCPEWKEKHNAAQYYGSANKGLGFYHINVESGPDRFKHWKGFDNYGVFTIEEGDMDEEEVLRTLREKCDKDWKCNLMKMEDYRYLVKFPPHRKVEDSVAMGGTSYFYLNKGAVMASLKVWDGEIEPVGQLIEAWVQVSGIPPKWSDWQTIREIASSLGRLMEVDWQVFFSSFFSVIRIKVNCKDPTKIPMQRVIEMNNQLFLITYKVEGFEQEQEDPEGKDGDGGNGQGDEGGQEDFDSEGEEADKGEKPQDKTPGKDGATGEKDKGSQNKGSMSKQQSSANEGRKGQKTSTKETEGPGRGPGIPNCISLLQAMELDDSSELNLTVVGERPEDEEMLLLPEEWIYNEQEARKSDGGEREGEEGRKREVWVSQQEKEEVMREEHQKQQEQNSKNRPELGPNRGKHWGPVKATRRSARNEGDTRSMLTRAQEAKRKWQQDPPKGKKLITNPLLSTNELRHSASVFCIVGQDGHPVSEDIIEKVELAEKNRDVIFVENREQLKGQENLEDRSDVITESQDSSQIHEEEDEDSFLFDEIVATMGHNSLPGKGEGGKGGRKRNKKKNR